MPSKLFPSSNLFPSVNLFPLAVRILVVSKNAQLILIKEPWTNGQLILNKDPWVSAQLIPV